MASSEERELVGGPSGDGEESLLKYAAAVEEGRDEDADEAFAGFMQDVAAFAEEHKDDPRMRLLEKADGLADAGDWAGAEAVWREALETSESDIESILPHQRLVDLYDYLGRHEDALAQARAATEAAGRIEMDILRAATLEQEARCLFAVGKAEAAIEAARRSIGCLGPERMADSIRARRLVFIARCHLAREDTDTAQRELDAARPLLETGSGQAFSGNDLILGSWWAMTARLRRLRGDVAGAVSAWEEGVACRRAPNILDPGAILRRLRLKTLADMLRELGRDRRAIGDVAGAEESLAEARAIYQAIGLPEPEPGA